ncbi:MAG: O-antigen ligase family protein [Candidatus Omnitrophica bacterium]|nr:O-antigen ligase family protein [Candidatus Omnitrophota bacterium]
MEFVGLLCYVVGVFVRPQEWVSLLNGLNLIDFIAAITILVTFMGIATKKNEIPRVPENFLMLGFFVATLMSQIVPAYFAGFLYTFDTMYKTCIFYFLIVIIVRSASEFRALAWTIILCATFMAISGFLQHYRGYGFAGLLPWTGEDGTGIPRIIGYGIFGDPNDLALLFVISFPFVLTFLFERRRIFSRVIAGIFGALIVGAIWFTNSRGGLLAFVVSIFVYFALRFKKVKWMIVSLICLIVIMNFLPSRMLSGIFDPSSQERLFFWAEGNLMLKENPLFGVGFQRFVEFSPRPAHNSFVNCYAELGLFGYFFWMGLIYMELIGLSKSKFYMTKEQEGYDEFLFQIKNAVLAGIIGYLTCGAFLTRTYDLPLFLLIAMGAKVRYVATNRKYLVGDLLPGYHIKRIFFFMGISIVLIYISVKFGITLF